MVSRTVDQKTARGLSPRQWIRLIVTYLLIPLVLFICGGDIGWWQAWLFSLLVLTAGIGSRVWTARRHPELLSERASFDRAANAKPWDKLLAPLMALSISFPMVIVAGLDHRFEWSLAFPLWAIFLGFVLIAAGYAFAAWAMAENCFFSGVVRIQVERGHTVCDSGPYRVVRHPGYVGNLLALPGMVLAFSSLWTIIPAAAALIIAVMRTALEDQVLQQDLPGYREYARRVRYRLFPGVY